MNVFFKWNKPNLSSKLCYRFSSHRTSIFLCRSLTIFKKRFKAKRFEKNTQKLEQGYGMSVHFFILVSIYCLLTNNVRVFKCLILLLLKKITSNLHGKIVQSILSYIWHKYDKQMYKFNWIHPNIKIMYNEKMNKK